MNFISKLIHPGKQMSSLTYLHQTATFHHKVTLIENQIEFKLQDFNEKKVYQKKYTNQNIGCQISKELKIKDIFYSFVKSPPQQPKSENSQTQNLTQFIRKQQLVSYPSGAIINLDDKPSYKIEIDDKGNKIITIFSQANFPSGKADFKTVLNLGQGRQMSELNITNKNLANLSLKLGNLEKQNQSLKEKLSSQEIKLEQLTLTKSETPETNKKLQLECSFIGARLKRMESKFVSMQQYYGLRTLCVNKFTRSSDNVVTLSTSDRDQYHYIFNAPIPNNQIFTFKVELIKVSNKNVTIGVVDYEKQKSSLNSSESGNAVCYNGAGYLYPSEKKEGAGLGEGDTVQVVVNLAQKSIKWSVNSQQRVTCSDDLLGGESRTFYPFIELRNQNDKVKFSQSVNSR